MFMHFQYLLYKFGCVLYVYRVPLNDPSQALNRPPYPLNDPKTNSAALYIPHSALQIESITLSISQPSQSLTILYYLKDFP